MELVALKSFRDVELGNVANGDVFECANPRKCRDMIARRLAAEAGATYETKVVRAEVKPLPAQPFRNVPDPDAESPALAAVRDSLRKASDVRAEGNTHRIERRERRRSHSR